MRTHGSPTFTIILFNHSSTFYLLSHAHKTTSIKAAGMHSNIFCEFLKPGEPGEEVEKNTRVMGGNNLSKSFHLFPGLQYIPNGAFYRQNIRHGFKKVAEACK